MADEVRLAASLQTAVLAVLCFDDAHGSAIAAQVLPEHFDSVYRDFATRVLTYRRRYGRPPGKNYIHDIAAMSAMGRDNTLVRERLLPNLLAEADVTNGEYVVNRVQDFVRRQVLKAAIFEASERYAQDDERMVDEVEGIFHKAIKFRQHTLDAGLFLTEPRALRFLDRGNDFVSLGIPELDRLGIGLKPKELMVYLAPKGSGKTWFCVHCGRQALLQRQKVVHISLEMDEEQIAGRYFQSLFGMARKPDRYDQTVMEFDELGRLTNLVDTSVKPKLHAADPKIRAILSQKMGAWGIRLGGLVIKSFPTSSLTVNQLISYLDYLEDVHSFSPWLLIVDYPKLMHTDPKNLRVSLGRNVEELRGVAGARNLALVAPHQGTRATIGARRVRSNDAGEDISVIQTADTVLAYSCTEAEERSNLGRLSVEHDRSSAGKSMIVLSQAYTSGQYVLQSMSMQKAYWDKVKDLSGELDDDSDED